MPPSWLIRYLCRRVSFLLNLLKYFIVFAKKVRLMCAHRNIYKNFLELRSFIAVRIIIWEPARFQDFMRRQQSEDFLKTEQSHKTKFRTLR